MNLKSIAKIETAEPTVVSLTDYYPYGMTEPGRSWNAGDYRFGYTGHEKENDLADGVYTTEYRLLDTRLGRWMSVDPVFHAGSSSYLYCLGNPVRLLDPNGEKETEFIADPENPVPFRNPENEFGKEDTRYNCHFFAWCTDEKDPTSLGFEKFCEKYKLIGPRIGPKTKNDIQKPTREHLRNYIQLSPDEDNEVGDRVLYYYDKDGDGIYNPDGQDQAIHSAIVSKVKDGATDEVISKPGSGPIRYTHPAWPDDDFNYWIDDDGNEVPVSRAYFRRLPSNQQEEKKQETDK